MRRALAVSTAAAALALIGCGDDGGSPAAERSPQQRAQDGALKFARCMRERGVDIPDPEVAGNGMIRIRPGAGSSARTVTPGPKERRAQEACRKHLEAGMPERTPAQDAEMRDAFVKYAECMRGEGIDMPDPSADGGGIRIRPGAGGGLDPESPKFKAAHTECEQHLAELRTRRAP